MTTQHDSDRAQEGAGAGSTTDTGTADQARRAAGTAADESRHVAEVARSQASEVASTARDEARNLIDEARSSVQDQARSQLESLTSTLQGFASDLESLAQGDEPGSGLAREVVTQASERARDLSRQLQGRDPSDLLDAARGFARRRPGTFLLGALAAGVVAGRLARGSATAAAGPGSAGSANSDDAHVGYPSPTDTELAAGVRAGTLTGEPLSGVEATAVDVPPPPHAPLAGLRTPGGTTP
ncbi:hypothetical protein [Nocardioides sp.]|uniref:hypothetical protein n=1 Tax=Nocardioides sp. TaxID=35761 RepID=UPI003517258A